MARITDLIVGYGAPLRLTRPNNSPISSWGPAPSTLVNYFPVLHRRNGINGGYRGAGGLARAAALAFELF